MCGYFEVLIVASDLLELHTCTCTHNQLLVAKVTSYGPTALMDVA